MVLLSLVDLFHSGVHVCSIRLAVHKRSLLGETIGKARRTTYIHMVPNAQQKSDVNHSLCAPSSGWRRLRRHFISPADFLRRFQFDHERDDEFVSIRISENEQREFSLLEPIRSWFSCQLSRVSHRRRPVARLGCPEHGS